MGFQYHLYIKRPMPKKISQIWARFNCLTFALHWRCSKVGCHWWRCFVCHCWRGSCVRHGGSTVGDGRSGCLVRDSWRWNGVGHGGRTIGHSGSRCLVDESWRWNGVGHGGSIIRRCGTSCRVGDGGSRSSVRQWSTLALALQSVGQTLVQRNLGERPPEEAVPVHTPATLAPRHTPQEPPLRTSSEPPLRTRPSIILVGLLLLFRCIRVGCESFGWLCSTHPNGRCLRCSIRDRRHRTVRHCGLWRCVGYCWC